MFYYSFPSSLGVPATLAAVSLLLASRSCLSQANEFDFSIDLLQGASGYYNVAGYDGVQPALTMVRCVYS